MSTSKPLPKKTYEPGAATKRCHDAILYLGYSHPHMMLIHGHIKNSYIEIGDSTTIGNQRITTMAVASNGNIYINPNFVFSLTQTELMGVLAHELLHLILHHLQRLGGRKMGLWNIATDCCINQALKIDGIQLPQHALYPPSEYKGDMYAEALYEWFERNPDKVPNVGDEPQPTAGCGEIDGGSDPQKWRDIANQAKAAAEAAGKGTAGLDRLLSPREQKINWREVIRTGFQQVAAVPGRDAQTWARRNRRSPPVGAQFPGWIGSNPKIAISIDVSGSMSPKMLEMISSEVKGLLKQFPSVRCYMNAHTSDVVWSSYVTQSTQAKMDEAFAFSGGTDPYPAYQDIKEKGEFDCLVHMTDTYFGSSWPEVPAKRLIVGAFTREIATQPPLGARVILCDPEL